MASRTYRLEGGRISGQIDGVEAVAQAALLILHTERWKYPVFSGQYGVQLESLLGKSRRYVQADLPRRLQEALGQEGRIEQIGDCQMAFSGDQVQLVLQLVADSEQIELERSVTIGGLGEL